MDLTLLHVVDSKRRNKLTFSGGTNTPAGGRKQTDVLGKTDKGKKNPSWTGERIRESKSKKKQEANVQSFVRLSNIT